MEITLQSPSIESFSYSWLANLKPSSFEDSLIASIDPSDHDEASFIEMDPRLPPSKRFIRVSSDFGFDFPVSDSPLGLVHADELISNGFLVPLFVKDMKMDRFEVEDDYHTSTASTSSSTQKTGRVRCASLRRCQRLSKRFFEKYLKFLLRPLFYRRHRGHQFESGNMRMSTNRNWEFSAATSPRTSLAYSADDNWRRSCDSESSIYEAVLHCKRTQGKFLSIMCFIFLD
ncbi:UNVERIFIED_CONTAM: putative membrane-associated kinase regulator 6 [Sesamum radiatum]|uniref:Membrane-associated kinase regulator 6 n=1 Tax=Sesamum radiatum TaxID=300843 RepID=A0AAW2K0T5_SESRA